MAILIRCIGAGVLIATLMWLLADGSSDPVEPLVPRSPQATAVEEASTATTLEQRVDAPGATEAAPTIEPVAAVVSAPTVASPCFRSERYPFEFSVGVRDAWGRWEPNAELFLAVEGQRFNRVPDKRGAGQFNVRFEAKWSRVTVRYFARSGEHGLTGVRTVELVTGNSKHVIVDLFNVAAKLGATSAAQDHSRVLGRSPKLAGDREAVSHFVARAGLDIEEVLTRDEERWAEFEASTVLEAAEAATFNYPAELSGVVLTEAGHPASGALVGLMTYDEREDHWTTTDHRGHWTIGELAPGRYGLRAGGDDFGLATGDRRISEGEQSSWDVQLSRTEEVTGRVVGPDDTPLELVVRAESSGRWNYGTDTTISDAEGRFSFPNAARPWLRVAFLNPAGNPVGIPIHVVERVGQDRPASAIKLTRDELLLSTVSVSLRDTEGLPIQNAEVLLLYPGRECGVLMTLDPISGDFARYSASGLPAGTYQLEATAPELGSIERHEFAVLPGLDLNLGTKLFAASGTVLVDGGGEELEDFDQWRIVRCGTRVDCIEWAGPGGKLFKRTGERPPVARVQLPDGDYLLSSTSKSIGHVAVPFHVTSGARTEIAIPFAQIAPVTIRYEEARWRDLVIVGELTEQDVIRTTWARGQTAWEVKLLPGSYRLEARRRERASRSRPATVYARKSFQVEPSTPCEVELP